MEPHGDFSITSASTTSPTSRRSRSSESSFAPKEAKPAPRRDGDAGRSGPSPTVRLNRFLALAGWGARRSCDDLIRSGRVSVNRERCEDPSRRVDPARDRVAVDGEATRLPRPATILLNKPAGVLVTMSDPGGRRTVVDLVRRAPDGLFPIGRLDRESEGLLLLTNDGDLAFRLTHPRFGMARRYRVWVRGDVSAEVVRRLEHGVLLREGRTAPAQVKVVRRSARGAVLRVTLREGRNREVRRMCEVVGLRVERLYREAFGPLALEGLAPGAWRHLTDAEVVELRRAVGLPDRGLAPSPARTRLGRGGRRP